jgi:hypothetical protein
MAWPFSFGDTSPRVAWLRAVLLSATFFGMLASMPLWMNGREFPLMPVFSQLPLLQPPWDQVLFGTLLALLVVACWFYRFGVLLFLLGSLFLVLADENRAQPWFYMYWIMLLLSLAPAPANLAGCRFALVAVYIWSGIQKYNPNFFKQVVPWFAYPAGKWLPPDSVQWIEWFIAAAPFVEIFIGLGLLFRFTRLAAVIAAVAVHVIALVFLGPLGHNINLVVWPWNLAMAALVLVLFPAVPIARAADLKESLMVAVVLVLFALLPILSFFGKWPSYLSFAVYSGNLATADIFVTESFRDRVPDSLRPFVQPTQQPYDPKIQGPYVFNYHQWAMKELRVPTLPEPRGFFALGRHLVATYGAKPHELRLIIAPRAGPTVLYQGSQSWMIVPSGK